MGQSWFSTTETASDSAQSKSGYLLLKEPAAVCGVELVAGLPKVPPVVCKLGGAESQSVTRVKQVDLTKPMQIQF